MVNIPTMCNGIWYQGSSTVLRIHDILGWIRFRIRRSMPLTDGSGSGFGSGSRSWNPDPAIFVIDFQDASKKLIF